MKESIHSIIIPRRLTHSLRVSKGGAVSPKPYEEEENIFIVFRQAITIRILPVTFQFPNNRENLKRRTTETCPRAGFEEEEKDEERRRGRKEKKEEKGKKNNKKNNTCTTETS